jgi:hypothetical protein
MSEDLDDHEAELWQEAAAAADRLREADARLAAVTRPSWDASLVDGYKDAEAAVRAWSWAAGRP